MEDFESRSNLRLYIELVSLFILQSAFNNITP